MNNTHFMFKPNASNILENTKAEVLKELLKIGYPVPSVLYFNIKDWRIKQNKIISEIQAKFFHHSHLAIRSSSQSEDTAENSMAGVFDSFLNVDSKEKISIKEAVDKVIGSFDDNLENQVLVQPMVENVAMSGVVMTKALDDGSPYYVINFDDSTGKTDTVTSGSSINKTVYVYNGVRDNYFDSPYLLTVLNLVKKLELLFVNIPLDIEFVVDKENKISLLQVRKITTVKKWKNDLNQMVSDKIIFLEDYVQSLMNRRVGIYGKKTLLGIMPDWNPAEMIGVIPRPLSMSLYREIITKSAWRIAREKMGYQNLPEVELMVSLYGRAYIDIRNSINSFLPKNINSEVSEKMTNAYIDRLENNPHLHDKLEFEIVLTAYDFTFEEKYNERYKNVLTREEFLQYKGAIFELTHKALENTKDSTLNLSLSKIEKLKNIQSKRKKGILNNPFNISDYINTLLTECIEYGTIPFSIIARHGFIAETLMRSIVSKGVLSKERITDFKRSIKTIASDMSKDFKAVCNRQISEESFLKLYGHLRPSSYDIMSPCYKNRKDLFGDVFKEQAELPEYSFELTKKERKSINLLLLEHGFNSVNADDLFLYAEKAIVGREYAKFIFTKHLSDILELTAKWGECLGFSRSEVSMLSIREIKRVLLSPLTNDMKEFFKTKIKKANKSLGLTSSFKLSYLIRTLRDIYIAPVQRNVANYIGNKSIERQIVVLGPYQKEKIDLENKIVCIEGADPGYDWIFTRNIAGLITKYGGANSHMAIRCAEYSLPAAIGCGEQPFEKILKAKTVILDCEGKRIEPQQY